MSIELREYLNFKPSVQASKNNTPPSITEGMFGNHQIMPDSVMVEIEGIHAGTVTRNFTRYTEQALRNSVPSWTSPYKRPLILHHNEYDGKIIGRIIAVEYAKDSKRTNAGSLKFTANVPYSDEQQQIKDGRLDTVSIGTMVHDAKCSICDQNIAKEGCCEHERGEYYEGKLCVWDIYGMEAKELSYVIVPSDEFAGTLECYAPDQSGGQQYRHYEESFEKKGVNKSVDIKTLTEQVDALNVEVTGLKEANTTAVSETTELKGKLEEATASIASLTEAKTEAETAKVEAEAAKTEAETAKVAAESAASVEKQLREQLEGEHATMVVKMKECLVESINAMRLAAGRESLTADKLAERSEDSLRDTLADMKEELHKSAPIVTPGKVIDPTLGDGKEGKEGKEETDESLTINVKEGLSKMFGLSNRK